MLNPSFGGQKYIARVIPTVRDTLDRYKSTFLGTQIVIGAITLFVLLKTHRVVAALAFFATMQLGALLGAAWGARLKNKIEDARMGVRR